MQGGLQVLVRLMSLRVCGGDEQGGGKVCVGLGKPG